jgi:hypothetical protein
VLRLIVLLLALSALLGAAAIAASGGSPREVAPPAGDLTLQQAQAFDEFPLVYAGEQVDGLPLVAILRRDDTADYVSFVYGDCRASSPDGGCAPPAEIQVWSAGGRNLGAYDASGGGPAPELTSIRGVPAAFFDAGTRLELYTPQLTVVVFARSTERLAKIAEALRCLSVRQPDPPAGGLLC